MSTTSARFEDITASTTASLGASFRPTRTGSVTRTSSTHISHNPNPTTPPFTHDYQWINSYLIIHKLTTPSYRYSFILYLVLVLFVLIFASLHWTGSRGGALGAAWSKWALRRRTWRKKHSLAQARREGKPHRQPFSFPSNAQMLSLVFLFVIPLTLCTLGPDYISPGTHIWDLTHNLTRRNEFDFSRLHNLYSRAPGPAVTETNRNPDYTIVRAWWTLGGRTGIIAFALFPLVILFSLKAPPFAVFAIPFLIQVHFDKLARLHRWTGRLIWLITTIHVATWGVQLWRDKRGNSNPILKNSPAWHFVWQYPLFIEGIIGYVAMTLLVVLSLDSFRARYYEAFYVLHLILVPTTLIFSALHFPILWGWCWSALGLWGCERIYRGIRWGYTNGLLGKNKIPSDASPPIVKRAAARDSPERAKAPLLGSNRDSQWELGIRPVDHGGYNPQYDNTLPLEHSRQVQRPPYARDYSSDSWMSDTRDPMDHDRQHSAATMGSRTELLDHQYPTPSPSPQSPHPLISSYPPARENSSQKPARYSKMPPPGFAIAQLMPGRVVRLRLLTCRPLSWAPGQHVLLTIPSVSKYTSHPFTISGCYDSENDNEGRVMELLVRAKGGFTKQLWDDVAYQVQTAQNPSQLYPFATRSSDPEHGEKGVIGRSAQQDGTVIMRAYVDGPFGSSIRAHWGNHSTVLIVAGGTGISFGVAVLEYLCHCLDRRDGKVLGGRPGGWGKKGFKTTRVRLVWLVREFSHIQWCASVIRRCMDMVAGSALDVDIFVSNVNVGNRASMAGDERGSMFFAGGLPDEQTLAPPTPRFMGRNRSGSNSSVDSLGSHGSNNNSHIDLSYARGGAVGADISHSNELGHEEHVLDYTNFDGEDDTHAPGEAQLNKKVQKEGKLRRAKTRRAASAAAAKVNLEQKTYESKGFGEHDRMPTGFPSPATTEMGERKFPKIPPRPELHSSNSSHPLSAPMSTASTGGGAVRDKTPHSAADQYRFLSPETTPNPTLDTRNQRTSVHSSSNNNFLSPIPRETLGTMSRENLRLSVYSMMGYDQERSPSPAGGSGRNEGRDSMASGDEDELPEVRLEIDDDELEDVAIVAEMTRPGKPKLDKILADEVERSRGAVAVACCGPASLNAVIRKIVAAQINPGRVLKGDMRGMISLITEEFQW